MTLLDNINWKMSYTYCENVCKILIIQNKLQGCIIYRYMACHYSRSMWVKVYATIIISVKFCIDLQGLDFLRSLCYKFVFWVRWVWIFKGFWLFLYLFFWKENVMNDEIPKFIWEWRCCSLCKYEGDWVDTCRLDFFMGCSFKP